MPLADMSACVGTETATKAMTVAAMMGKGDKDYTRLHNNQLRGSDNDTIKGDKEGEEKDSKSDCNGGYKDDGNKSDNSSGNKGKQQQR
jgi:hypothetical protein